MTALVAGIFFASLLGSLHCAGMCGAFLAIAINGIGPDRPRQAPLQIAYHGGRLITYVTLGIAAGTLGHLLDLTSSLAGLRPIAAAIAGATLLAFGLYTLLRLYGYAPAHFPVPGFLQRLTRAGHQKAFHRPPIIRAALIGLFTTLLPCGWLYAFVITAAGTASPWRGGLAMAVFWLGTLPVMIALGATLRGFTGVLGKRLPVITCLMLMSLGTYTLINRSRLDPAALARRSGGVSTIADVQTAPSCCKTK